MGRVSKKKTTSVEPEPEPVPAPAPVVAPEKKKRVAGKKRIVQKSRYRAIWNRICKESNIPKLHPDAVEIIDCAALDIINRLVDQGNSMIVAPRKTYSRKCANTSFVSYAESVGGSIETTKAAVMRGNECVARIGASKNKE